MTQEELARKAKISRPMLSLIENDKAIPSVYTAMSLARALEAPIEKLFPRSSSPPKKSSRPKAKTPTGRSRERR